MSYPFKPQVFVGEFHGWKLFWLEVMGWGRMFCRDAPKAGYQGEPWTFDNGAFGAWVNGEKWDAQKYLRRLQRAKELRPNDPPTMAVIPDVPGDCDATLKAAEHWLNCGSLPSAWPWYLALQDGMTETMIERWLRDWGPIGGLFLGGTDSFKRTAAAWSDFAHARKMPFHYARCGNVAKLRLAIEANSDSVDSTGIIQNERRDNSFWRYAMEWKHPTAQFQWKRCREMAAVAE